MKVASIISFIFILSSTASFADEAAPEPAAVPVACSIEIQNAALNKAKANHLIDCTAAEPVLSADSQALLEKGTVQLTCKEYISTTSIAGVVVVYPFSRVVVEASATEHPMPACSNIEI
jgi:hypothetical protein